MFNPLRLLIFIAIGLIVSSGNAQDAAKQAAEKLDETIFSGPQIGEALPGFKMKLALGDGVGSEFDLVEKAGDQPVVVIFVHKRSRPAFGLANSIMRYCDQDGGDNLHRGLCFLTDDPTETANWMGRTQKYFPENTPIGYSTEGIEGPGSMGLNRNVELTVLVGKQKKVVANFALVQPGAHVDGPKILAAIAKATGAKEVPDINKYLPSNQAAQDAPIAIDPGLMTQIRKINAKDATDEMVGEGITEIETMIKDNQPLQNQLGSIVTRWVNTKRVDTIGNDGHQTQIKKWAAEFGPKMNRRSRQMDSQGADRKEMDPKFSGLMRAVIQKSNSDEQVDEAAKAVEQYVAQNPAAATELARIANTIVNSDKLPNYGTPHAQQVLKAWAEKFPVKKE